jgi:mitogen-activated protein kinase 1/3
LEERQFSRVFFPPPLLLLIKIFTLEKFQGKHYLEQIECIIAVLGTPTDDDVTYRVEERTRQYINQLPRREKVNWEQLFPNANPLALDLLKNMLAYNPHRRY